MADFKPDPLRPWTNIQQLLAWGNTEAAAGNLDAAQEHCDQVQVLIDELHVEAATAHDRTVVVAEAALLRAVIAAYHDHKELTELPNEVRELCQIAVKRASDLGASDLEAQARAHRVFGAVLAYYGENEAAEKELRRALAFLNPVKSAAMWTMTACQLAEMRAAMGHTTNAAALLNEATSVLSIPTVFTRSARSVSDPVHPEHIEAAIQHILLLWSMKAVGIAEAQRDRLREYLTHTDRKDGVYARARLLTRGSYTLYQFRYPNRRTLKI